MALENEGSNPSAHPIVSIREAGFPLKSRNGAPVAQWIRALVFGFVQLLTSQYKKEVASTFFEPLHLGSSDRTLSNSRSAICFCDGYTPAEIVKHRAYPLMPAPKSGGYAGGGNILAFKGVFSNITLSSLINPRFVKLVGIP